MKRRYNLLKKKQKMMKIKNNKGVSTILMAIMILTFIQLLFLGLHKNTSSLIKLEKHTKEFISRQKIAGLLAEVLKDSSVCTRTFKNSYGPISKIQNKRGEDIFNFATNLGFLEKTTLKIKEISIHKNNSTGLELCKNNRKDTNCRSIEATDPYEYPTGSGHRYQIATLAIKFEEKLQTTSKVIYHFTPIYLEEQGSTLKSCSTSEIDLNQLACGKITNIEIICCRYKYKIDVDPSIHRGSAKLTVGQTMTITQKIRSVTSRRPSTPTIYKSERNGIIPSSDGTRIENDCEAGIDKITAEVKSTCTLKHGWSIQISCKN